MNRSGNSPFGGAALAAALAGAAAAGGGAWAGAGVWLLLVARRTSIRQVGQVCCLWNQERRQLQKDRNNNQLRLRRCRRTGFLFTRHLITANIQILTLFSLNPALKSNPPGVKDVITWQLLGSGDHLLPTNDADVVRSLQVLRGGIRVSEQRQQFNFRDSTFKEI